MSLSIKKTSHFPIVPNCLFSLFYVAYPGLADQICRVPTDIPPVWIMGAKPCKKEFFINLATK
jgi:hypothetical protein